jgi:thiamine biosynthesis lipoprotein
MTLVDNSLKASFRGFLYSAVYTALFVLTSCQSEVNTIEGTAQGTTYVIKYTGTSQVDKSEIDGMLDGIDGSLSTWDSTSIISKLNRGDTLQPVDTHFLNNLLQSIYIRRITDNSFNPLIKPVVNYWGFGENYNEVSVVDSALIADLLMLSKPDSVMLYTGDKFVSLLRYRQLLKKPSLTLLKKKDAGIMFDFNGIAQGYSVDVIVDYLKSRGVKGALVELGGEMKAYGLKDDGSEWVVGIDTPVDKGDRQIMATITLTDNAIATSGNYRKYYESNGKRIHHTIDPNTGFPAYNDMLSSTVLHRSCAIADAMATAFMVMGSAKAKNFIELNKTLGMDAYLIYLENGKIKTWISPDLVKKIKEIPQ